MFMSLKSQGKITEKELKYFTYEYQKATNLGKMYLLPKIHKSLSNVPGRPFLLQRMWLDYTPQFPTIMDLKPLKTF